MSYSLGVSDPVLDALAQNKLDEEYAATHGGQERPGFFSNLGTIMKLSLVLAAIVVIGVPLSKAMKG